LELALFEAKLSCDISLGLVSEAKTIDSNFGKARQATVLISVRNRPSIKVIENLLVLFLISIVKQNWFK
jgi:hypothetical protein